MSIKIDTAQYAEMMAIKATILDQYQAYKKSGFTADESLALVEGSFESKPFFIPITRLWIRLSEVKG